MSVLPVGFGSAAGGTPAGAVESSLRFNSADSANLSRTPASAGNRKTFSLSFWMKRSVIGVTNIQIFGQGGGMSDGTGAALWFTGTADKLGFYHSAGSSVNIDGVLRDPSSYYHVVLAVDTTQAQPLHSLSDSRVRIYINGVQQTTSGTLPSQNTDLTINQAVQHRISGTTNSNYYFNGYLTEINFIDGQALTPSSFGETDTNTGVWKPKAYTGSYGTNGFYLPFKTANQWSGYFDGSNDYLSVANNTAWQYGTGDFTLECWLLGTTAGSFSNQYIFGRYNTSAGTYGALQIGNSTTIYWYYANGGAYSFTLGTALTTNRWYHFAVSRSGTSLRFFLDGTQIGSTQTDSTNYSGTAEFRIINAHQSSATYFPGYISNVRVVKGSAVYTANFTPSTQSLTAITNTVLLTCQSSTFIDNSTNNFTITNNGGVITQQFSPFTLDVTDDHSGQGNHWQPNNLDLRTTGAGADILVDSPTSYGTDTGVGGEVRGNYCTMNPLQYSSTYVTLNNGNLNVTGSSGADAGGAFGTAKVNSGKWYWEATIVAVSGTYPFIGFAVNTSGTQYQGGARVNTSGTLAIVSPESFITLNGSPSGTSFTTNDVLQFALDMDNGKMWIGKNGTWMNSGVPASGTGNVFSISDRTQFVSPYIFSYNSSQVAYNFGQRAFAYTAPSGFKALCTQNLPTPTIGATSTTQADNYFSPVLYTGTGSTRSITSLEFQPDFTWIKPRSAADYHILYDAVRGVRKQLYTSLTNAEETETQGLSAFLSNGFTLGGAHTVRGQTNDSGVTYVSWNWKANGAGVTNTDGQITSTVSANNDAGFSIVTYTGNGSANQTVGHGCKVGGVATAPTFGILKDRDTNSNNSQWQVFHTGAGDNYAYLSTTAAFTGTAEFYPTSGSSTTVTVGRGVAATTNESGDRFVMYLFADVEGYSKAFSYASNNTSDNAFVYLGFRPRWIMIKSESTGGVNFDWVIYDTARMTYNYIANTELRANLTTTEGGLARNPAIDILSNGFKVRSSAGEIGSSTLYVGMAFAETPFKYALAR